MSDAIDREHERSEEEERKAERAEADAKSKETSLDKAGAKADFEKARTTSLEAARHREEECRLIKDEVSRAKDALEAAEKALKANAADTTLQKKVSDAAKALEGWLRRGVAAHAAAADDYDRANRCQEKAPSGKKGADFANDSSEIQRHREKAQEHLKTAGHWCEWIARVNIEHPDKLADYDEATKWLQKALLYQGLIDDANGVDDINRIEDKIHDVAVAKEAAKKKGQK